MKFKTNTLGAKIMSSLLVLSMVFSSCPVTTYADSNEFTEVTVDEETSDETVVIADDETTDPNVDSIPENDTIVEDEIVTETEEPPQQDGTTETVEETTSEDVTSEEFTSEETSTETTSEESSEETTEMTSEDTTEEVTDEKTSEESTEEVATEEDVTEETTEEVEEEPELIVFDHYFSEINESLVQTPDLLVQTSDPTVFTKNTNVVSNYDDVYVISCDSVQEAKYVYSYYVDKVANITDMSNVMSLASDENPEDVADLDNLNNGNDAIANLDEINVKNYSGYIALIDSGANADVNYSVVGDDTSDSNGHGTQMLNYIKEENPNAKVMSIKVFNGSSTSAADVYAGIKLAIESNVSVINLSLVGANVEKNAIIKDAIQEAINNGIVVIGAAGNYNTNAKSYIPGCVSNVITVGAANEDGTKNAYSNFNADVYVVATSTSEACARYSGMYTANNTENDRVFTELNTNSNEPNEEIPSEYYDYFNNPIILPMGTDLGTLDLGETSVKYDSNLSKDYETTITLYRRDDQGVGYGYIKVDDISHDSYLYKCLNEAGYTTIDVDCSGHYPDDTTDSSSAKGMQTGTVNMKVHYETSEPDSDGKVHINFKLQFSEDDNWTVSWEDVTDSFKWKIEKVPLDNGNADYTSSINGTVIETKTNVHPNAEGGVISTMASTLASKVRNSGGYTGYRYVSEGGTLPSATGAWSGTYNFYYKYAAHSQIFKRDIKAWRYATIELSVDKKIDSNYTDLVADNPNYSLDGTTFGIYDKNDDGTYTRIKDVDDKNATITISVENGTVKSSTVELDAEWAEQTVYLKELTAGKGYILPSKVPGATDADIYTAKKLPKAGGSATVKIDNRPIDDPATLKIHKISDINASGEVTGNINLAGAEYVVEQYYNNADALSGTSPVRSWTYATDSTGFIFFMDDSQIVSQKSDELYLDTDEEITWPIGTYKIYETVAPNENGVNTGLELSDTIFYVTVAQSEEGSDVPKTTYYINDFNTTAPLINDGQTATPELAATESEKWLSIGLNKVDRDKHFQTNTPIVGLTMGDYTPQAMAKFKNAVYLVCTDDLSIFENYDNAVETTDYTIGYTGSLDSINGIALDAEAVSKVDRNKIICVNGSPLTIVTDDTGYGETAYKLPWSSAGTYYVQEVAAPEGYKVNSTKWYVDDTWTTGPEGTTVPGLDGREVATLKSVDGAPRGQAPDEVIRGRVNIQKIDANYDSSEPHGDADLSNIRYAVVYDATNPSSMIWPKVNSTTYRNVPPTVINPGEVVYVVSTTADGKASLAELPYGDYTVYELRKDADLSVIKTNAVWDAQATKNALGTSIYANESYMYSDYYDSATISENDADYDVEPVPLQIRDESTQSAGFKNYIVRGNIEIRKFDSETDVQAPEQGNNTFEGIRYAIVNRSAANVYYEGASYDVNEVIDILTLNENGFAKTTDVPYGTYAIYELRKDATIEAGDVYDNNPKLGTSIYANDYYVYSDNISQKLIDTDNPTYSVEFVEVSIEEAADVEATKFSNAPVRGDITLAKYDIDGYTKGYIPYKITLLDENGEVCKDANGNPYSHIILADKNGKVDTATRAKSADTVNTLDKYYQNGIYVGPVDGDAADEAAKVNVWFGDIDRYVDAKYINQSRGSFLYGTYLVEELSCETTAGDSLVTTTITVTEDGVTSTSDNVIIDTEIWMQSEALDVRSGTNILTMGLESKVVDNLVITHVKSDYTYKVETEAVNVLKDGTTVSLGKNMSDTFTVKLDDEGNTSIEWGTLSSTNDTNYRTTQVDIEVGFDIDTTQCEPGSYVALVDTLYQYSTTEDTWIPISTHNTLYNVEAQKLYVPDFNTKSTNLTTGVRIGSIDPMTEATDKFMYENFGNNDYNVAIKLVDDNGNIIKDADGNDCIREVILYTSTNYRQFNVINGAVYGPSTSEFTLADMGCAPFVVPKTDEFSNAYFVVTITNVGQVDGVPTVQTIFEHNVDRDVEDETIRWIEIGTTAASATGYEGIIPNDTEVELVDTIHYENCAETVEVLIEGKVVLRNETTDADGNVTYSEGEVVATNSETATLTAGSGNTSVSFTFDSTPYAGKSLVVYEYVYIVDGDSKTLIAKHDDITDTKQTVMVPKIETELVNSHKGEGYKVVSQIYEDVTLIDYVTYTNVKPGDPWTLTATIMDKNTGEPVKDADGNNVTVDHVFTPTEPNGVEPVEITFKRVLTETSWENDESWVCFESLKPATPGHDTYEYAVHNDINDNDQTVRHPKFRTTAVSENGTKQIAPAPDQTVIDTVELKNFDSATDVAEGDKFTLQIVPHNAENGRPIVDAEGNIYTNTKTFVYTGQTEEKISVTFDATGLEGATIVFFEYLYFGESTDEEDLVLREDDVTNFNQSVTIPELKTNARDKDTNTKNLAVNGTLVDEISAKGIMADTKYTIVTKVVDKTASAEAGTEVFVKDKDGNEIQATYEYTSPKASETGYMCTVCGNIYESEDAAIQHCTDVCENSSYAAVVISTVFDKFEVSIPMKDAVGIEGHDIVVYEYMYLDGKLYASHTDIDDKDQTIEVPDCQTKATDPVDNDNIIDGTSTKAEIIDTVTYTNLIPGQEYTVTGKLAVKPKSTDSGVTVDNEGNLVVSDDYNYTYVTDENGQIITQEVTFVAEQANGTIDVKFTIDASKYAGRHLVAFETIKIDDVEMVIHADINDAPQTIIVPLKLHVQIAKADRDDVQYFLKDAEITIFKKGVNGEPDTIAKDVNGNDCVGMTDENGQVDFTVIYYSEEDEFYAMETKAPRGYQLCEDKFEIYPTGDRESLGTDLIKISILDAIIIVPPTGDSTPIIILVAVLGIGIVGVITLVATRGKKKKDETNETEDTNNDVDDNPEIIESETSETDEVEEDTTEDNA